MSWDCYDDNSQLHNDCSDMAEQIAKLQAELKSSIETVANWIRECGNLKAKMERLVEEAYEEGADDMRHGHEAYWSESGSKRALENK